VFDVARPPFIAMLADFAIPVLFRNIVGGTALFVLLSYAQVMRESQNAA
jgi:formate/nitrite transporter FocA (FNT family)